MRVSGVRAQLYPVRTAPWRLHRLERIDRIHRLRLLRLRAPARHCLILLHNCCIEPCYGREDHGSHTVSRASRIAALPLVRGRVPGCD